jgi:metal-sulfur cluster biosynthetic enzyme
MSSREDILRALHGVTDSEVGINIVDLGLIYRVEVVSNCVRIVMTMTTPACLMHLYLTSEVRETVMDACDDVASVEAEIVWVPPWSPRMITEHGKQQLGWN